MYQIQRQILEIYVYEDIVYDVLLVGWMCFTSHRQRGHLETVPPFTVPCEGREPRF